MPLLRLRSAGLAGALLLVTAPLSTACGGAGTAGPVDVSTRFHAAVEVGDGAAACSLLAQGTRDELESSSGAPCQDAVVDQGLPVAGDVGDVATFGTAALVRHARDVTFLSRYRDSWRVVAVGCTPTPPDRYDCALEAG